MRTNTAIYQKIKNRVQINIIKQKQNVQQWVKQVVEKPAKV